MSAITLPLVFGSNNAKGLLDGRYAKAGTKLGCPRVSSLDSRLRPLYTVLGQRTDPRYERASALLLTLQESCALERQNLACLAGEITAMIDPDSPLQPGAQQGECIELTYQYPLTWSAVRLVKAYDDLMCLIQFLYSTGGLTSDDPLLQARKLRQRAGKPVRRFLTQVSKDVASVDFL